MTNVRDDVVKPVKTWVCWRELLLIAVVSASSTIIAARADERIRAKDSRSWLEPEKTVVISALTVTTTVIRD